MTENTALQNIVLIGTLFSWASAVLVKGVISLWRNRTITASDLFGPGGMPSTHTCPFMTCTVLIGYVEGWDSSLFALACAVASVVMYDASGIRRAAGKHAQAINLIFRDLFDQGHLKNSKLEELREILGHQPIEVLAGAILGILIGVGLHGWLVTHPIFGAAHAVAIVP